MKRHARTLDMPSASASLCLRVHSLCALLGLWREIRKDLPGPIVLINEFIVAPSDRERFVTQWSAIAAHLRTAPGFGSAQLHAAIGSNRWLNYATWASSAALGEALRAPDFRELARGLPAVGVARLYRVQINLPT
ncbi:MAG: antibiotic biosynthesis monooxygenase family protein [Polyangia bacterium]